MATPAIATTNVTVRLFGPEAQTAGSSDLTIAMPDGARAPDVLEAIERQCPPLSGRIAHCRLAVNHEFASAQTVVKPGDEVALIGLVSGG